MATRERLDKYLAHHADMTRSVARRLIHAGAVTLGGIVTRDTGTHVTPGDSVCLDGHPVEANGPCYLMLHKPAGIVCDRDDGHHRSVFDLIDHRRRHTLHVAGRLDADTTGLVLLTDDGAWSHRITAPRHKQSKCYEVTTADPIAPDCVATFASGLMLEGETTPTRPATLTLIGVNCATLLLQEGRYHQVKRMFAAVGNRVVGLHRRAIGTLSLPDDLAPGQWRPLTATEIAQAGGMA